MAAADVLHPQTTGRRHRHEVYIAFAATRGFANCHRRGSAVAPRFAASTTTRRSAKVITDSFMCRGGPLPAAHATSPLHLARWRRSPMRSESPLGEFDRHSCRGDPTFACGSAANRSTTPRQHSRTHTHRSRFISKPAPFSSFSRRTVAGSWGRRIGERLMVVDCTGDWISTTRGFRDGGGSSRQSQKPG